MFRSLLVPLDGSTFGEHALPWALSIARRAGAALRLIHVHSPLAIAYPEAVPVDESVEIHLKQQQLAYLHGIVQRLRDVSDVAATCELLEGGIAESIRVAAESTGTDLVVMTTHGRSPLGRFWLGSVADALVRELSMPVLLVRPHETAPDLRREPLLKHLLLPLDGSPLAEQIIEPALALGRLMDADFTLLRVIKPPTPPSYSLEGASLGEKVQSVLDQMERLQQQLQKEAAAYLERVAERLRQQSLSVQTRVAVEHQPAVAILEEAVPPAIDLVALETHGRRGLSRLFLGSVADKVIRGTSVPVLVQRPVFG
jgi:nucleotide-binding universal stress UspA family protein